MGPLATFAAVFFVFGGLSHDLVCQAQVEAANGVVAFGFRDGDPNADDDPTNDILHPVYVGQAWDSYITVEELAAVRSPFVEYFSTKSIVGTKYDDLITGERRPRRNCQD